MSESKKVKIKTTAILAVEIEIDCTGKLDENSTDDERREFVKKSPEIFDFVSIAVVASNTLRERNPNTEFYWTPIMDAEPMRNLNG